MTQSLVFFGKTLLDIRIYEFKERPALRKWHQGKFTKGTISNLLRSEWKTGKTGTRVYTFFNNRMGTIPFDGGASEDIFSHYLGPGIFDAWNVLEGANVFLQ